MRRRTVLAVGAAAVVGGCSTPAPPSAGPGNSFAVRGVRVFDGERLTGYDTVLVDRGQIVSVGRGLPLPRGTLEAAMANVAALHRANVAILAGTDAGNPGTTAGASLLGELGLLVRAGLSPVEALRAATSVPARCFNLADRGRIAPGLRAELVLARGDPTTAIDDVRDAAAVWKNGYLVPRVGSS